MKIIFKRNAGVYETRIIGICAGVGEYILFLDADDYLDKECFKKFY